MPFTEFPIHIAYLLPIPRIKTCNPVEINGRRKHISHGGHFKAKRMLYWHNSIELLLVFFVSLPHVQSAVSKVFFERIDRVRWHLWLNRVTMNICLPLSCVSMFWYCPATTIISEFRETFQCACYGYCYGLRDCNFDVVACASFSRSLCMYIMRSYDIFFFSFCTFFFSVWLSCIGNGASILNALWFYR